VSFTGKLYPFQERTVDRMLDQKKHLVACDMGLGKTVLSIAAAERLMDDGGGSGFIICPASIKHQWRRMIDEFTDGEASVVLVSGLARDREKQYRTYKAEADYLIINPEQMVNDWEVVNKLPRTFIIADEVTWAKNFRPKRSKRLKRLEAEYHWGLTGQPVENRAEEVYSIMQWINPDVLGDHERFDRAFIVRNQWGGVRFYRNLPTLHKLLSQHMTRYTRDEVKDQLPAVVEESVLVDFDTAGAKLYRTITKELLQDLEEASSTFGNKFTLWGFYHGQDESGMEMRGRIMSKLTNLRMLCDHPHLLRISAAYFRDEEKKERTGSVYADELQHRGLLDLHTSPKLDATLDLIGELLQASRKNKIVVFSYFTDMIDILAKETAMMTKSVKFTGKMTTEARDRSKEQFDTDPDTRLFLSSDAGGRGLDLPKANFLVSYDLPWSGGAYAQRKSRIIRLSSQFPEVTVISVLMSDSVEERQYDSLDQKQRIADAVTDGKGINAKGRLNLDLVSLKEFLEERAV
jgi:SNF2 family DNA or RNA helicase